MEQISFIKTNKIHYFLKFHISSNDWKVPSIRTNITSWVDVFEPFCNTSAYLLLKRVYI